MFKIDHLTYEELKQLRRDISNALEGFDSNRRRQCLKEIKQVCKKYGYELKDVVGERVPKEDK